MTFYFVFKRLGKEILQTNSSYKIQSLLSVYRRGEDEKFCTKNLNPLGFYPFSTEKLK